MTTITTTTTTTPREQQMSSTTTTTTTQLGTITAEPRPAPAGWVIVNDFSPGFIGSIYATEDEALAADRRIVGLPAGRSTTVSGQAYLPRHIAPVDADGDLIEDDLGKTWMLQRLTVELHSRDGRTYGRCGERTFGEWDTGEPMPETVRERIMDWAEREVDRRGAAVAEVPVVTTEVGA